MWQRIMPSYRTTRYQVSYDQLSIWHYIAGKHSLPPDLPNKNKKNRNITMTHCLPTSANTQCHTTH